VAEPAEAGRNRNSFVPLPFRKAPGPACPLRRYQMNSVIYLVGLVVVVMAILSFVGLR
jgi:hypothetical protein